MSAAQPAATILLVEDDPVQRAQVAETLTRAGYAVLQADDADEAIVILEARSSVRLVFAADQMRGTMDGVKLAHFVARRWPPIKLFIAAGRQIPSAGLPLGTRTCIRPCEPETMVATIADHLLIRPPDQLLQ